MNPAKPRNKCLYCGKQMDTRSNRNNVYCNTEHEHLHKHDLLIEGWLSGEVSYSTHRVWMRDFMMDKQGCKCSQCEWSETNPITGTVPLEIHHLDGNSTNNLISNLSLICPNCHSLTETFRGLNRNNSKRNR